MPHFARNRSQRFLVFAPLLSTTLAIGSAGCSQDPGADDINSAIVTTTTPPATAQPPEPAPPAP